MPEIVSKLFGLSPEAFKQQRQDRDDERALALAQLDPFQRASFNIQRGADRLAGVVGGMLGGQDPELQRRTQAQQIMGMIDPSDPDTFLRAAEMALQGGDQQLALGLRQEGEKARQQALVRGDQERVRQGLRAEDDRKATAFIQNQELDALVRSAFVPGTPAQDGIAAVPDSFNLESIKSELLQTPRGREKLKELVAAQELTRPKEFKLGSTDRVVVQNPDGTFTEKVSAVPPKPGITTRQLTKAEAEERGLPGGKSYQIDSTGKIFVIGGGGVNVQVGPKTESLYGPIGQGMERYVDEGGTVRERPVPGSAQDVARTREVAKAEGRKKQTAQAGGTVVQDLQRALTSVQRNPKASGRSAALTLALPEVVRAETEAQAVFGFIQSALSNVGLDTLQTMRENSPTGGALGQVPIQQQKRLEEVLGSLDQTQRKEVVEDNLKRVINIYMDTIHGTQDEINQRLENGDITSEQKEAFGFRHKLSFDELGNPIGKSGRGRGNTPVSAQPIFATNPTTKERIMSTDGGKTWNSAR